MLPGKEFDPGNGSRHEPRGIRRARRHDRHPGRAIRLMNGVLVTVVQVRAERDHTGGKHPKAPLEGFDVAVAVDGDG
jgi:hypothetical protein